MNKEKNKLIIQKIKDYRKFYKLTQLDMGRRLGVSQNYIYMIESGRTRPSDRLSMLFDALCQRPDLVEEGPQTTAQLRLIPVLSWPQLSQLVDIKQVPKNIQEKIPTDLSDSHALAVRLHGDAMEPEFRDRDVAVLAPGMALASGALVIAKLKNAGLLFRLLHYSRDGLILKLSSYNPAYPLMEFEQRDFDWIYPVESVLKKIQPRG